MKLWKKFVTAGLILLAAAFFNLYYPVAIALLVVHALIKYYSMSDHGMINKLKVGFFITIDLILISLILFVPEIRILKIFTLPQIVLIFAAFLVFLWPSLKKTKCLMRASDLFNGQRSESTNFSSGNNPTGLTQDASSPGTSFA